ASDADVKFADIRVNAAVRSPGSTPSAFITAKVRGSDIRSASVGSWGYRSIGSAAPAEAVFWSCRRFSPLDGAESNESGKHDDRPPAGRLLPCFCKARRPPWSWQRGSLYEDQDSFS